MPDSLMALENKRYWHTRRAVSTYWLMEVVEPGEQAALDACDAKLRGDVLELGAGSGRISQHLQRIARSFVATDYSQTMVERGRERFPHIDFRLGDMRDLSPFADESLDAVCMFGSAIDDVELDDRARVLAEVRRVLRPGGVFVFSSHNLEYRFAPAWSTEWMRRGPWNYLRGIVNSLRQRPHQIRGDDWAILNDPHDSFSVLTVYIRRERQVRVLEQAGFCDVRMFGVAEGRLLRPGEVCRDYAIQYLATRR